MNPRDFLELASELAAGSREVDWRTAASRAYYGAFHVAASLLHASGFSVPADQSCHAYVWLRLSNAGEDQIVQVGRGLQKLRGVRGQADYDMVQPFPELLGVAAFNEAMTIVSHLDDLAATPAILAEVITTIRTYERDILRQVTWRGP